MNHAVKHYSFEHEPIKHKNVCDIPGIEQNFQVIFAQYGITHATQLLGQFMMFNFDTVRFATWLSTIAPMISRNNIMLCTNSLKEWCSTNL